MKLIDLHVHSNISDGTFTPRELAFYAKTKGLSAIALTDHDTVLGVTECINAGNLVDLEVISGIELSAQYEHLEIHILGYNIDIKNPYLLHKLGELIKVREARNVQMIAKFRILGISLTLNDLYPTDKQEGILTRAHFAKALLDKGYVKDMDEAFDRYLSSGRPCYIKRETFPYRTCIDMIHAAGGLAVLAHPMLYDLPMSKYPNFIKDLTIAGIDGIETIYPKHSDLDTLHLLDLCKKHNLVPTGGSDFHGKNKPHIDIGTGFGSTKVPYQVLEALLNRKLLNQ